MTECPECGGTFRPGERTTTDAWPDDGDVGVCPDCNKPVCYSSENGSYGVWFHVDGQENCQSAAPAAREKETRDA